MKSLSQKVKNPFAKRDQTFERNCGIGVLNLSTWSPDGERTGISIGLSMGATHYFDNGLKHGEIFYRNPGAVLYTVYAQLDKVISTTRCVAEVTGTTAAAVVVAPLLVVGAFKVRYLLQDSQKYTAKGSCFAGKKGTWLILRGGPYQNEKGEEVCSPLSLAVASQAEVLANGTLVGESAKAFYKPQTLTGKKNRLRAATHDCNRAGRRCPATIPEGKTQAGGHDQTEDHELKLDASRSGEQYQPVSGPQSQTVQPGNDEATEWIAAKDQPVSPAAQSQMVQPSKGEGTELL